MKATPFSAALFLYCFFLFWSVVSLAGYHFQLVSLGATTNEQIKKLWRVSNPYSFGFVLNWKRHYFGPTYPSSIEFITKHNVVLNRSNDLIRGVKKVYPSQEKSNPMKDVLTPLLITK